MSTARERCRPSATSPRRLGRHPLGLSPNFLRVSEVSPSSVPNEEEQTMNPVPKSFVNKIFNLDAIGSTEMLPDDCIPLTVTSPPYDQLRTFGGVTWNAATFQKIAEELWRITMPGGVVVWVVADTIVNGSETCTSARQKLYFR